MPITFTVHKDAGYFLAKYEGEVTEKFLIEAHKLFFESGEWNPRLNALVNINEAEFMENSNDAIRRISQFFERVLVGNNANGIKTAVIANKDFSYGVARIYEAMTALSVQTVQVFRDMGEAKKWLEENSNNGQ